MVSISKNDKEIWEQYTSNLERFTLKLDEKNKSTQSNYIKRKIFHNSSYTNAYKLLKKGKIKPDAIIDLHGFKLQTGKLKLQKYIVYAHERNIRNILVITGKGQNQKGVLKKEVPIWLKNEEIKKFLISFEVAPKNLGGEGALLVRVKNKNINI
jgi:DNA-nicking Smr family endonuclease